MPITLTQENKNTAVITLEVKYTDLVLDDIKDLTFNDVLLPDGTLVKNTTFDQLKALVLALESKNPTVLTDETKN